jgi:hypothetical protein
MQSLHPIPVSRDCSKVDSDFFEKIEIAKIEIPESENSLIGKLSKS